MACMKQYWLIMVIVDHDWHHDQVQPLLNMIIINHYILQSFTMIGTTIDYHQPTVSWDSQHQS